MNNKDVLARAMNLLARQDQSSQILKRKLFAQGYKADEINTAIDKLIQRKYLDDESNCKQQFEDLYNSEKFSLKQIIFKLVRRGFNKNFIEQLIPLDSEKHELRTANFLLSQKFKTSTQEKFKANAWNFLASKGFEENIISSTVKKFYNVKYNIITSNIT